jgi:hypothetical protein
MKRMLELLIDWLYVEPQVYQVENEISKLDRTFNWLQIKSQYKRWLFEKILEKVDAQKRIDTADIAWVIHSLNSKFDKLMRKGWVGKRFIDLVDELEERAELATKKLEELNEQIQKDMDFSRIILN